MFAFIASKNKRPQSDLDFLNGTRQAEKTISSNPSNAKDSGVVILKSIPQDESSSDTRHNPFSFLARLLKNFIFLLFLHAIFVFWLPGPSAPFERHPINIKSQVTLSEIKDLPITKGLYKSYIVSTPVSELDLNDQVVSLLMELSQDSELWVYADSKRMSYSLDSRMKHIKLPSPGVSGPGFYIYMNAGDIKLYSSEIIGDDSVPVINKTLTRVAYFLEDPDRLSGTGFGEGAFYRYVVYKGVGILDRLAVKYVSLLNGLKSVDAETLE